jgi:hypothetical protein
VTEKVQIFGQYNIVVRPKIQGTLPQAVVDEILGPPSNFQAFGVGFSYFVIPERERRIVARYATIAWDAKSEAV